MKEMLHEPSLSKIKEEQSSSFLSFWGFFCNVPSVLIPFSVKLYVLVNNRLNIIHAMVKYNSGAPSLTSMVNMLISLDTILKKNFIDQDESSMINSFWRIQENSSRKLPKISFFRVKSHTVLLENSSNKSYDCLFSFEKISGLSLTILRSVSRPGIRLILCSANCFVLDKFSSNTV